MKIRRARLRRIVLLRRRTLLREHNLDMKAISIYQIVFLRTAHRRIAASTRRQGNNRPNKTRRQIIATSRRQASQFLVSRLLRIIFRLPHQAIQIHHLVRPRLLNPSFLQVTQHEHRCDRSFAMSAQVTGTDEVIISRKLATWCTVLPIALIRKSWLIILKRDLWTTTVVKSFAHLVRRQRSYSLLFRMTDCLQSNHMIQ